MTDALATLAARYAPLDIGETERPAPLVYLVAPPGVPFLTKLQAEKPDDRWLGLLDGIVEVRQAGAPTESATTGAAFRSEMATLCDMRVCVGGAKAPDGILPVTATDALDTLRAGHPVFAAAIFGGAARLVIDGLSGGSVECDGMSSVPGLLEYRQEVYALASAIDRPLAEEEERQLWMSPSTEQCIAYLLRGCSKWWAKHGAGKQD
jgi:hypothetical protein